MSTGISIEPRGGRILVGDRLGMPYVITPEGLRAFDIDASASQGQEIVSNFAVTERREQSASGVRFVRTYFYGTQDGWIYKFDSRR